jgi:pseudouridine-5'-phosphate glycosidase
VSSRVNNPEEAAALIAAHWRLDGAGVVLAQPVDEGVGLTQEELQEALNRAETDAAAAGVRGKDVTPFLLMRLADLTGGRSVRMNQDLVIANARLAARVARAFQDLKA